MKPACHYVLTITFAILISINVAEVSSAQTQVETASRIAFVAFTDGQWDIFSVSPTGDDLRRLTDDVYEDADPSYSPDGTHLVFSSRRQGNWDLYLLDLQTGIERRMTQNPHYDGDASWHPEGNQLAFESFRGDDLDIWLIKDISNPVPVNLTTESIAGEFDPVWHSDGHHLFFTSWREGDHDLWLLDLDTLAIEQLTTATSSESQAFWIASQSRLAFSRNQLGDKDIFWVDPETKQLEQRTWLGSLSSPVFDQSGSKTVGVFRLYDGDLLTRLDEDDPIPLPLTERGIIRDGLSWHSQAVVTGTIVNTILNLDKSSLYTETLRASSSPHGEPYDLIRLNDLKAGSPWLADTVDDSYQALRRRVEAEVGYDFLGDVSEAWRPLDFFSEVSQYSSWHKSGRAVDTRFDWPGQRMQIAREDIGGETYWRIFLRCDDQTGRCGESVTANFWNYSGQARNVVAPGQGGTEWPNRSGYYVDFTALATQYGWVRIASFDDEDFSWTWHFKAFEYWHYQKVFERSDGSTNWYQAMLDVYPRFRVEEYFTWDKMRAADEDPYLIVVKGVPIPPLAQRWWQTLTP